MFYLHKYYIILVILQCYFASNHKEFAFEYCGSVLEQIFFVFMWEFVIHNVLVTTRQKGFALNEGNVSLKLYCESACLHSMLRSYFCTIEVGFESWHNLFLMRFRAESSEHCLMKNSMNI